MAKEEFMITINQHAVDMAEQCVQFGNGMTFSELVKNIDSSVKALACSLLEQAYWLADCEYNLLRDRDKIKIKDTKKTRKLVTVFGEVTLRRRMYQVASTKKLFYAIDQNCGIKKYARVESSLKAKLIDVAIDTSYGKASMFLDKIVSRQSVYNFCRDVLLEDAPVACNTNAHNVYIEADEDHIHLNNGKPGIVKMIYAHEGRKPVCKGRTALINPRYFVSIDDDNDGIWSDVAHYVEESYRNPYIKIYGDGGTWIKESARIFKGAPFCLDKFHVRQAILIASQGDKSEMQKISRAVRNKSSFELKQIHKSMYSPGRQSSKKAVESILYLMNNIDDISFSKEDKCSAESHVSHLLSSRMSSRPMGWSKRGAERMAKLRAFKFNGGNIENLVNNQHKIKMSNHVFNGKRPYERIWDDENKIKAEEYIGVFNGNVVGYSGVRDELFKKLHKIL